MTARELIDFLQEARASIIRTPTSIRETFFNQLREVTLLNRPSGRDESSRPSRSNDYYYEERDYGYRNRRQDRSRGHPSRQRHPMEEMRRERECGFDPYEDDYDHYRLRNSDHRYHQKSPERWKKSSDPPPTPRFKIRSGRKYIKIMDLFDISEREQRKKGVAIFIRGAPSSGKSILAKLIMEKEQSMGNRKIVYLTVNEYYEYPPGNAAMSLYREKMKKLAEEEFSRDSKDFFVVEVDGGPIEEFEKLYNIAMERENVTCYLIECKQSVDTCLKYVNARVEEMKEIHRLIEDEAPNEHVLLIDAEEMYVKNPRKERMIELMKKSSEGHDYTSISHKDASKLEKLDNPYSKVKRSGNLTDLANQVAELMKDPDILELIEASVANISLKEKQDNSQKFEKLTEVKPKNCFDYKHKRIITDDDFLFNVQLRTVIDYNHRSSNELRLFIKGINIDEIIASRKSKKLREKVLKNYGMAENPEDIQSTSSYPNNWIVIRRFRTKPILKRKKTRNAKIERHLEKLRK